MQTAKIMEKTVAILTPDDERVLDMLRSLVKPAGKTPEPLTRDAVTDAAIAWTAVMLRKQPEEKGDKWIATFTPRDGRPGKTSAKVSILDNADLQTVLDRIGRPRAVCVRACLRAFLAHVDKTPPAPPVEKVSIELFRERLDDRNKLVLDMRMTRDPPRTSQDLGLILGVSRQWVERMERELRERMEREVEGGPPEKKRGRTQGRAAPTGGTEVKIRRGSFYLVRLGEGNRIGQVTGVDNRNRTAMVRPWHAGPEAWGEPKETAFRDVLGVPEHSDARLKAARAKPKKRRRKR